MDKENLTEIISPLKGAPVRRYAQHVLLVRGGALGRNTGIGGAHHNLVSSLQNGDVRDG